ncbi:unnamed protein product [Darwinula stevensoni]|uniref:CARD domain-containing protein n=1 Tax=Darwinula stevensoni TaxID=69355 RepID=A0A7R9AB58_9CRUS|nr:unnamed protein product [Darwinula stevensoni]CAG0899105.1 unnamed protein product [Darwinula stevensoni]
MCPLTELEAFPKTGNPSSAEEFCQQLFNRGPGASLSPTSHDQCGLCLPGVTSAPIGLLVFFPEGATESITHTIEGATIVDLTHQSAIRRIWTKLRAEMDVKEVMNHLLQEGMLQMDEWVEIDNIAVETERRERLLCWVYSKDFQVYRIFQDGLDAANQTHLANRLQETLLINFIPVNDDESITIKT